MKLANSFLTIPLISIWGFYAMWFGQVDTLLQQSLHPLIASLLTLKLLLHFLFSSNKPSVCCSGSLGNGTYPVLCKSYLEMILLKKSYFFSPKSHQMQIVSQLLVQVLCVGILSGWVCISLAHTFTTTVFIGATSLFCWGKKCFLDVNYDSWVLNLSAVFFFFERS